MLTYGRHVAPGSGSETEDIAGRLRCGNNNPEKMVLAFR
jgi:hypothetical protein